MGLTSLPESKPSFTDADLSIAVQRARPVEDEDEDEDTPMGEDHVPEASAQGAQSGPDQAPQKQQQNSQEQESLLRNLHTILLETQIVEGILVCGNCGHEYPIKESVANFLLPSHLGKFCAVTVCCLVSLRCRPRNRMWQTSRSAENCALQPKG